MPGTSAKPARAAFPVSPEVAVRITISFLSDFTEEELRYCIDKAYDGKFDTEAIAPLAEVKNAWYLELFHGPTIAFKDMALSILPYLMTKLFLCKIRQQKLHHFICGLSIIHLCKLVQRFIKEGNAWGTNRPPSDARPSRIALDADTPSSFPLVLLYKTSMLPPFSAAVAQLRFFFLSVSLNFITGFLTGQYLFRFFVFIQRTHVRHAQTI